MARPAASDLPAPPARRAHEVKRKLDGSEQRFDLECWLATPDLFVGRWVAGPGNAFGAPPGVTSWGVWWRTRPYGAYRIHDGDGAVRLYRLDVIRDVELSREGVRYCDLLLDALIRPRDDGLDLRLDDEDEVEAATEDGTLSAADQRRIRWTREVFVRRTERVAQRIDAAIDRAIEAVRAEGGGG